MVPHEVVLLQWQQIQMSSTGQMSRPDPLSKQASRACVLSSFKHQHHVTSQLERRLAALPNKESPVECEILSRRSDSASTRYKFKPQEIDGGDLTTEIETGLIIEFRPAGAVKYSTGNR
jgi:hypothetical protein